MFKYKHIFYKIIKYLFKNVDVFKTNNVKEITYLCIVINMCHFSSTFSAFYYIHIKHLIAVYMIIYYSVMMLEKCYANTMKTINSCSSR